MSPGLLVTSHQSLVTSHSFLFSFSQRFLFNVPYHLSFPTESVTTDCPHRGDFI